MEGVPKTAVVKREPSGKWFVVVVREAEDALAPDLTASLTGFDLGLSALVTDSNGITVAPACSTRKGAKKLRREQRKLSRAMSGSKRRAKQRQKVARVYERIAAQRAHRRHKVTSRLVNDPAHKGLVFEDLRITNMLKNPRLSKSISDAAWGDFLRAMACKAERAGKPFVLVGPAQHHAGVLGMRACVGPKGLEERIHRCVGEGGCRLVLSRDENAARSIKRRGEALPREWLEEAKPKSRKPEKSPKRRKLRREPSEAGRCPKSAARNARGEAFSTTHQHGVRQVVSKKREAPSFRAG